MEGKQNQSSGYGFRPRLVWDAGVYKYLSHAYGSTQFDAICEALTRPCVNSTVRVNTLQASTEEVMEHLRSHFVKKAGFSSSLRRTGPVDGPQAPADSAVLTAREGASVTDVEFHAYSCWEHPLLKDVVMVGGRGPCDVDYRGVGGPVKEVVVSRKCAEAVLRGANVFVPGVLACSPHVEKGDMVAVTVAVERPDGNGGWRVGITRGTTLESEHALAQMGGTSRNDHFIGMGRMTMSRMAVFRESKGVAVEMAKRIFDLPPFHGLLTGQIFLQNLPSIVAARVLDPKPGERILDMCAAPGGKTTAIGILMKDQGEVVALDRSHSKVLDITRLSKEMKLTCIQTFKLDATKSVTKEEIVAMTDDIPPKPVCSCDSNPVNVSTAGSISSLSSYEIKAAARKEARRMKNMVAKETAALRRAKGFQPQSFDRVLLDAPCSALGLRPRLFAGEVGMASPTKKKLTRSVLGATLFCGEYIPVAFPVAVTSETLETLRQHCCYQRKLFDQAVQLVRPGGTLVYSTCTINPGENEAVVRYALDTYDFLSLVPQEPRIGGPGLVGGRDVFDGMSYKEWLRGGEEHLVQRFNPCESYDTTGFFIAKFAVSPESRSL